MSSAPLPEVGRGATGEMHPMARIVFMGTPEAAVPSMRAVAGAPGARLVGVFTQTDKPVGRGRRPQPSPVKAAAGTLGIPVLTPAKSGDAQAMAALEDWRPEMIVVCAYGRILPRRVLERPPLGCYNLHFSLLPRWRGASPVQAAILAGDRSTGVSLQRMVRALDAGAVAAESEPEPIGPGDTAETLTARLAEISAALIRVRLPALLEGNPSLREQDAEAVTHCGIIRKEHGAVRWAEQSAADIERMVRAYTPWPRCFGFLAGRRLGLVKLEPAEPPGESPTAPGTLHADGRVPAREGWVRLLEVKPEGKGAMPFAAFKNGNPQAVGETIRPEHKA